MLDLITRTSELYIKTKEDKELEYINTNSKRNKNQIYCREAQRTNKFQSNSKTNHPIKENISLTVYNNIPPIRKEKVTKNLQPITKQDNLSYFGFKGKYSNKNKTPITTSNQSTQKEILIHNQPAGIISQGDSLTKLKFNQIRIYYMNINGRDLGRADHSMLQLCRSLYAKDVDLIYLTETNLS